MLLEAGADVDALNNYDNTPLVLAVCNHHGEAVATLLQAGADVTVVNKYTGNTPILQAAIRGNSQIVLMLC